MENKRLVNIAADLFDLLKSEDKLWRAGKPDPLEICCQGEMEYPDGRDSDEDFLFALKIHEADHWSGIIKGEFEMAMIPKSARNLLDIFKPIRSHWTVSAIEEKSTKKSKKGKKKKSV